jgi:hypothetical protein
MFADDALDVEAATDGFYVADRFGERVALLYRNLDTGVWEAGTAIDGVGEPRGVGRLPGGGVVVATEGCQVWRKASATAKQLVAGTGVCASSTPVASAGDGGPATAALLFQPADVEATPDGGYVLIERDRVRRIAPDGTASTLANTAILLTNDAMGPTPTALEVTPDGDVLIGLERRVLRFDTNYAPPAPPPPAPGPQPVSPLPVQNQPAAEAKKIAAALARSRYRLRAGKRLKLRFDAGAGGSYVVDVRKGRKRIKRVRGFAKAGENVVRVRMPRKRGRYKLTLTVTGADGTKATDAAKLRLTR